MKFLSNKFSGVLLGSAYALGMRLILNNKVLKQDVLHTGLASVTFLIVVPVIVGCIPVMFAPKDKKPSVWLAIWSPSLSVIIFFFWAFLARIEDSICLIILLLPFIVSAIIGGLLVRFIVVRRRKKAGLVYSLLVVPLISSIIEGSIPSPTATMSYSNSVVIHTTPEKIWPNIVRVKEMHEGEYRKGFFYYSGVPRPLYAELDRDTLGATRIGHFQGGLRFVEKVSAWERNKKLSLDITVDESSLGNSVFDNHILKGGQFRFLNACYRLTPVDASTTKLTLTCSYELKTKVNAYGLWWGRTLLDDFQGRLLEVIKKRCDNL